MFTVGQANCIHTLYCHSIHNLRVHSFVMDPVKSTANFVTSLVDEVSKGYTDRARAYATEQKAVGSRTARTLE